MNTVLDYLPALVVISLFGALLAAFWRKGSPRHDYLSTACYHTLHERCRKQCKFCAVPCKCECHKEKP